MKKYCTLLFFIATISFGNAQNYKFGKVSEKELLEKQHALNPEANATILYSYQRTYYDFSRNSGFNLVTEIRQRIKIYNKDGFDWATKEITVYGGSNDETVSSIKGVTYNLIDGKIQEEKLERDKIFLEESSKYNKTTKFTMPAIKEGCVIEYEYAIKSPYLGAIDPIQLQYTVPINQVDISVTIPEYLVFKVHNNPRAPFYVDIKTSSKPFKRTVTDNVMSGSGKTHRTEMVNSTINFSQNVYEINQENIPALKQEERVDYLYNYAAFLKWELQYTNFPNTPIDNYSQTWDAVTTSIYNDVGYASELKNVNIFKDDLDRLLVDVSDPFQKAAMIYYFVKQKVQWNGIYGFYPEHGIKKAYKEGSGNSGDINLLLTAMLNYAKLQANPVLVSTQNNGVPLFPTRNGFNYLITALKLNSTMMLMDATDHSASIGELPRRARNWQGRLIESNGASQWINLQPTNKSEMRSQLNIQLADTKLKGKSTRFYKGLFAKKFREVYLSTEKEEYTNKLVEDKGNISLSEVEVENKFNFGSEIKETYSFVLDNGMEIINNNIYLKPLLFEKMDENPFKADERFYPIFFQYPSTNNQVINIMVPQGYEVNSLPKDLIVQLANEAGDFKYIVRHQGKFIRVESEVNINRLVFNPQDFEFLKAFYGNIVEKHNEAIVFTKINKNGTEKSAAGGR
ncbi:DUF3857 domain-containing protein [Gramella sp. AN32]|uniref:DUF3857 domain-containing protein n=1 Tax=Christiangramia antarctica TaxID=2058158 RepID=A0ABW5X662_9FLAO|nr:DUF3857 domain-containing protein [Gramella sp. AN32]MCM4157194.1 transglutaminase [Gramella sp. AN32]